MLAPTATGEKVAVEEVVKALDGFEGLGAVGRIDDNNAHIEGGIDIEEVSLKMDKELVLARLTGKDSYEGIPRMGANGVEQTGQDSGLIGAQDNPGGVTDEGKRVGEDGDEMGETGVCVIWMSHCHADSMTYLQGQRGKFFFFFCFAVRQRVP